jgi:hypothetical protein
MFRKEPKNYVGPRWLQKYFHPPMWYFVNASAKIHDENYRKGGTSYNRLMADLGFFRRMIQDISLIDIKQLRAKAYWYACLYYMLVRSFGWICFNYHERT